MTQLLPPPTSADSPAPRRPALFLATAHATVDFYQGAIAALVPFFVLTAGFTAAQAGAVVLAASASSSLVQPLFGLLADRFRLTWVPGGGLWGWGGPSSLGQHAGCGICRGFPAGFSR